MTPRSRFTLMAVVPLLALGFVVDVQAQAASRPSDAVATALERGDYATALREARALATKGDKGGQYQLGLMYFSGWGVERDWAEAAKWFRLSANQGEEYAKLMLGICLNGLGQFEESAQILRWAAQKGEASAQYLLALQYLNGKGLPHDTSQALRYLRMAADQNYASAQTEMGRLLFLGPAGRRDVPLAVSYLRKAAAQNEPQGQVMLGYLLYAGEGVAADPAEAVRLWLKSAARGVADAQTALGLAYYEGKGVQQSSAEAARWLRAAAEQDEAKAQHQLAVLHHRGDGVPRDDVQALMWLRLSAHANIEGGSELRQKVEGAMTAQQVQQAERLAAQRRSRP
jgi:TPR repeat protein